MSEPLKLRRQKRDDIVLGSDSMPDPAAHKAMNDEFSAGGKHRREAAKEEATLRGAHIDAENELLGNVSTEQFMRRREAMRRGFTTDELLEYAETFQEPASQRYKDLSVEDFRRLRNRETGGR